MASDDKSNDNPATNNKYAETSRYLRESKPLKSLDKDLKGFGRLEKAGRDTLPRATALGICLLFLMLVWAYVQNQSGGLAGSSFIIAAAVIGGYMALKHRRK